MDPEMLTATAQRQARLFARSSDERERIVAEAVARAWAARDRYDHRRGSMEAWLFGLVRNVAREQRRDAARQIGLLERLRRRETATSGTDEQLFELSDAFARLPEREQLALYLRYWCDLPHADVARRLEMRPDAARQLVRRAIVRLGRLLR